MNLFMAVAVASFALMATAEARLGETFDELISRYGNPLSREHKLNYELVTFKVNEYGLLIVLSNKVAQCLVIQKNTAFEDLEIKLLLDKNTGKDGGVIWVADGQGKWVLCSSKGKTGGEAFFDKDANTLTLALKKALILFAEEERLEAQKKAKETEEKLKKF
jgi:hypothetical protein